jgi:hypothetical protein
VVRDVDPPIIRKEMKLSLGGAPNPTYVTNPVELAKYLNNGPFAWNRTHNANYFVTSNYHVVYFNFKKEINSFLEELKDPLKSDLLCNHLRDCVRTLERPNGVEVIYKEMKALIEDIDNPGKRKILQNDLEDPKKIATLKKVLKNNKILQEGGNCDFTTSWDDHFSNGGYWDYRYANGGLYPGTTPVGIYSNQGTYGTYDMAGNVAQWVNWPSGGSRIIFGASWKDGLPEVGRPLYQHNGNGNIIYDQVGGDGSSTKFISQPRTQKGDSNGDLYELRLPMDHCFKRTLAPDFKNDYIGFRIAAPVSSTISKDSSGNLDILETSDLDPKK